MKGLIIRNGLELNSSWAKRVIHWRLSFNENIFNTKIISAYPNKPVEFINGTEGIYYLLGIKLPQLVVYFISPFLLLKYLIREKPDFVLLANGGFFEFYTIPIYCRLAKIPLLVDMVDTIGRMYKTNKSIIDYLIIWNKKLYDRYIVRYSNEVFVISTDLEMKYKKLYPHKKISKSVPSTVDVKQFEEVSKLEIKFLGNSIYDLFNDRETIKIFYAGTITRLNGIEFFFKAFSEIISGIDLKIKIIFAIIQGDVDKLIDLSCKYKLENHIVIVPSVPQKYLPILLCKADILFIPEQGTEIANAGFPGKTSEYLLSGIPIITTNFSDLGNYLINEINSCISNLGDIISYKTNLNRLIIEPQFRNEIGLNGKKLAIELFSHQNCSLPFISSVNSFYKTNN